MNKVTVLEKDSGKTWSNKEVGKLASANVEVEQLRARPSRIVAMNKPIPFQPFYQILGHSEFTATEVDCHDRWAD